MFEEVSEVVVYGEAFTAFVRMENATCTFRIDDDEIYGESDDM